MSVFKDIPKDFKEIEADTKYALKMIEEEDIKTYDTLFSLEQQIKRIIEKANACQERILKAYDDLEE